MSAWTKKLSSVEWYLVAVVAGIVLAAGSTVLLERSGRENQIRRAPDFAAIENISERKEMFFEFLLPYIHEQNAKLIKDRTRVIKLKASVDSGRKLRRADRRWITALRVDMELEESPLDDPAFFSDLLSRLDAIPPSLALAQAANESGWGTSRFAREGFNYYGIWCYQPGCGMVPRRRPAGTTYEVTRYSSARESVGDYFAKLNTGRAYLPMRRIRQQLRERGEPIDGIKLANGLERYSERGMDYVRDIQGMISSNDLLQYDR